MSAHDRLQAARDSYRAYETEDRGLIEGLLSDDFVFYSPPDPGIDRAKYFEVCWPNAGNAIAVTINSPTKKGSTSGKFTNTPFRTPLDPLISALHENFCFEKIGSAEP